MILWGLYKMTRTRKITKGCSIEMIKTKKGILIKCKNLKRHPSMQEIINGLDTKIIMK